MPPEQQHRTCPARFRNSICSLGTRTRTSGPSSRCSSIASETRAVSLLLLRAQYPGSAMANVTTYVQKSEEDSTGFSSIVKV